MTGNHAALYDAWRKEIQRSDVQPLPEGFHSKMAGYIKRLREEAKADDKDPVRARIVEKELEQTERMIRELGEARLRKIVMFELNEKPVDVLNLTAEEKRLQVDLRRLLGAHNQATKHILLGQELKTELPPGPATQRNPPPQQPAQQTPQAQKTVRFTQPLPAIMGTDMKTYGPFSAEDVASLPAQNAENLIRKGIAKEVETSP